MLTPTTVDVPKPRIIDSHDVIVKVTGSTVCGSDVHLMHGVIVQTEKGDILGHEFCGVIESVGPAVTKLSPGDRVVNSFCISCGECRYCKQKLPTACEKTNASRLHAEMYGGRLSGIFGYSHFVGGYAGGQAEFVRVPLAENNLMKLPDSVPDEKGRLEGLRLRISSSLGSWAFPFSSLVLLLTSHSQKYRPVPLRRSAHVLSRVETIHYELLKGDETVPTKLHEMVPGGVDVSIDATGGEYGKGFMHKLELATGMEQDTSEMVNEAIYSTRKFGRVGIIADYVGCKC